MDVFEKIKKIEALIASSKSDGKRQTAELAKNRILERQQQEIAAKLIEYKVSLGDLWKKELLIALCNKYWSLDKIEHTLSLLASSEA